MYFVFLSVLFLIIMVCVLSVRLLDKRIFIESINPDVSDRVVLEMNEKYKPPRLKQSKVRLGIICMTKQPIAFSSWLAHHRHDMNVEHFFICVEDTPFLTQWLETTAPWSECVSVWNSTGTQAYFSQMDRQSAHVRQSIVEARQRGLTHVLHIDDDELLFCPSGRNLFHNHLMNMNADTVTLRNIEAVYEKEDCKNPFKTATTFSVHPTEFSAYVNGKSIGCLAHSNLEPDGPHLFNGRRKIIPSYIAVIAHYESSCIAKWRIKFDAYAKDTPKACERNEIPFRFYCDSIESRHPSIWQKWKTRGRHADRLLTLSIYNQF